jgi:hypothetical protein
VTLSRPTHCTKTDHCMCVCESVIKKSCCECFCVFLMVLTALPHLKLLAVRLADGRLRDGILGDMDVGNGTVNAIQRHRSGGLAAALSHFDLGLTNCVESCKKKTESVC